MAAGMCQRVISPDDPKSQCSSIIRKDPFVGNVSKVAPRPKGHTGPVQKGQLVFDACFESGNLGRVDYISDFEYDLFIRPDTCNPRFRVWFYFTVENVAAGQRVLLNIVNFSKSKSLYRNGMTPLVMSSSRRKWQRIPSKNVFYYRSPEHSKNYVLTIAFAFDKEKDVYHFAYCYPYSYSRLQGYLSKLDQMSAACYKKELLAFSVQQRRLDLLTITSPKNLQPGSPCKMVFITARVHPGETPASYVCQGLIDFLLSAEPEAQVLRDHLVFKIVPMLNPDGVYLGNYRCSLMGFDLNRHWHEPSPWAHPTLAATKQLLLQYNQDPNTQLDFYIDFHAHSTLTSGFMYGNVYDSVERCEGHTVFPRLLSRRAEDFSWAHTSFNQDAAKAGTGRRFLGNCLNDHTNCYTLEVSFFSYGTPGNSAGQTVYTEQAYLKLGENVAKTFVDYYNLEGEVRRKKESKTCTGSPASEATTKGGLQHT